MTKELDAHKKEVEQKSKRITDLSNQIKDNKIRLENLEAEYKNAVIKDAPNIDKLFHQVESLQADLRADKFKLKTLQSVTDEHLKKHAIDTLNSFHSDVTDDYKIKATKVNEKIKQTKQVYIKSVLLLEDELNVINDEFEVTARKYAKVMNQHDVTKDDISSVLFSELDNAKHGVIKDLQVENKTIQITEFNKEMN